MKDNVSSKAASGVAGLDEILGGGFTRGALFLIEGSPGHGKNYPCLAIFAGRRGAGERTLYITLSETKDELAKGSGLAWVEPRRQCGSV